MGNTFTPQQSSLIEAKFLSQPKLDTLRGVQGYGLGDTKSVDTPVSWLYFTMQFFFFTFSFVFTGKKRVDIGNPIKNAQFQPPSKLREGKQQQKFLH